MTEVRSRIVKVTSHLANGKTVIEFQAAVSVKNISDIDVAAELVEGLSTQTFPTKGRLSGSYEDGEAERFSVSATAKFNVKEDAEKGLAALMKSAGQEILEVKA